MTLASRLDLIVVGVYMVLMLLVGLLVSRYNKSESDFFRSGNMLPWWLSGISLFMGMFSVWTFTGAAGRCTWQNQPIPIRSLRPHHPFPTMSTFEIEGGVPLRGTVRSSWWNCHRIASKSG